MLSRKIILLSFLNMFSKFDVVVEAVGVGVGQVVTTANTWHHSHPPSHYVSIYLSQNFVFHLC